MTAVSRALSVHRAQQISGFSSESSVLQLIGDYSPKGAHAIKKRNLLEFLGTIESFWTILDISKRILELFSGKFRKDFDVIFRELSS